MSPREATADPYVGGETVASTWYKLPAQVHPDVRPDLETELWAAVWHPENMGQGPYPLIMMLHGNHDTCGDLSFPRHDSSNEYTTEGQCGVANPSYPVVVPNHMGYEYLAERLASFGYIVVSINANRGVNAASGLMDDPALIWTRGRLILKHLEQWSQWNESGGAPTTLNPLFDPGEFYQNVDLSDIGLFGHSRGGAAIRAAQNLYLSVFSTWSTDIPDLGFGGLFEVAPTDYADLGLVPLDVPWHAVIALCDGDVTTGEGAAVFGKTFGDSSESPPGAKGLWWLHGANHNFFNSEWQIEDFQSEWCNDDYSATPAMWVDDSGGSALQQYSLTTAVIPFMRQHVGSQNPAEFIHHRGFANPLYELDPSLPFFGVRVDRQYVDSPSYTVVEVLDDFEAIDQIGMHGVAFETQDVAVSEEVISVNVTAEEGRLRASWDAGGTPMLDLLFVGGGNGIDLSGFSTLDFRVARKGGMTTGLAVQLLGPGNQVSNAIDLATVADLVEPFWMAVTHTARFRLGDFNLSLDDVRGVRFLFDESGEGEIWLDDVLFSRYGQGTIGYFPFPGDLVAPSAPSAGLRPPLVHAGTFSKLGRGLGHWSNGRIDEVFEIEVSSIVEIEDNALVPVLVIGAHRFSVSRECTYSAPGGHCRIFSIEEADYARLVNQAPVSVTYDSTGAPSWILGSF